jgi:hypothetical protein
MHQGTPDSNRRRRPAESAQSVVAGTAPPRKTEQNGLITSVLDAMGFDGRPFFAIPGPKSLATHIRARARAFTAHGHAWL